MVQAQLSEPHRADEATPSPARLDHSSCQSYLHPPGSRIFFPATRSSAGHGVTEPRWEPGSCPACVALPWSSVQPGTSQQDLAAGAAQRSPAGTLQGQSTCSAGILCVPGCAWRSWRWEQGRKDAQPVGYKAFPLPAARALRCVDVQAQSEFTSMIWAPSCHGSPLQPLPPWLLQVRGEL